MSESTRRRIRAGLSTIQMPHDVLVDAGGMPDALPRSELLRHGGFYFFMDWLMREHRIEPRGVLHVGGNVGQEGVPYMMMGFEKALFFEANPSTFRTLAENVAAFNLLDQELADYLKTRRRTSFAAVEVAIGDRDGEVTLYLMGASTFCSTRKPKSFSAWMQYVVEHSTPEEAADFLMWAKGALELTGEVKVQMKTLDRVLRESLPHTWQPSDFNVLSLNIQGGELDALRGATNTLKYIQFIQAEKNYLEHYEGCAIAEDLDAFLEDAGFKEVMAMRMGPVGTSAYVSVRPRAV